jgi:predicted nuclease of restriction endonuclease-like RecB superfamily
MGLALNDLPLTVRRVAGQVHVYPRLLRDGSMLPRIALAIDYFESLLGQERQQLEPEMLVELFGQPGLARGIAAALGHSYRFRARSVDEVVGRAGGARLKRVGLASSPTLRLWLYDQLNDAQAGFLPAGVRPEVWPRLERALKLRPGQLEQVLYLDRPEHLRLERIGGRPRPADVACRYNFQVLESLLRHADLVEFVVDAGAAADAEVAAALCRAHEVDAAFDRGTRRLRLRGRQDALGGWARHGRRLARGMLEVLDRARGLVSEAEAWVAVRGRRGLLRLGPEALDMLGGPAQATLEWEPDDVSRVLRTCSSTLRGRGWHVRVEPDARVSAEGVVLADLLVQSTAQPTPSLVVAVRGPRHARRLLAVARAAPLAERLVFVGRDVDLLELRAAGAAVLAVPYTGGAPPDRLHLARLVRDELSERKDAQAA